MLSSSSDDEDFVKIGLAKRKNGNTGLRNITKLSILNQKVPEEANFTYKSPKSKLDNNSDNVVSKPLFNVKDIYFYFALLTSLVIFLPIVLLLQLYALKAFLALAWHVVLLLLHKRTICPNHQI